MTGWMFMHILHPGINNVTCLIDIKNANFKKEKKKHRKVT